MLQVSRRRFLCGCCGGMNFESFGEGMKEIVENLMEFSFGGEGGGSQYPNTAGRKRGTELSGPSSDRNGTKLRFPCLPLPFTNIRTSKFPAEMRSFLSIFHLVILFKPFAQTNHVFFRARHFVSQTR
jgi:hypothetical protein